MSPIGNSYGVPCDVEKVLKYLKDRYSNPKIIITENGFGDVRNDYQPLEIILNDTLRTSYLQDTLYYVKRSIREDGANVIGYYIWSLLDNFEWVYGYSSKFGLYYVNISSASLVRYPKLSALWYFNFLNTIEKNIF
eukprot:TRINITY_DN131_c0_g1_i13.p1 TRINITY_DN131_c0_g1~~TRINITY_DN131_c0_g1_i13.p1  ORF type:complete len:136 (-),score=15.39 TRINITY_DN131_c0_g1_i13:377-784(-)